MSRCIGLFGTCGTSKWREPFIERYKMLGIEYFNPQVPDWNPACAVLEAQHLKEDSIILFPVTGETFAFGSLAETGFSILHAIRMNTERDVVVMIEMVIDSELEGRSPDMAKDSMRARKLVMENLGKLDLPSLWIVKDLKTMLNLSIELWNQQFIRSTIKQKLLAGAL